MEKWAGGRKHGCSMQLECKTLHLFCLVKETAGHTHPPVQNHFRMAGDEIFTQPKIIFAWPSGLGPKLFSPEFGTPKHFDTKHYYYYYIYQNCYYYYYQNIQNINLSTFDTF